MQNLLIPNQIIKTKRKSISLIIKNNGDFIVRAPLNCNNDKIIDFINKKSDWIILKRTQNLSNIVKPLVVENNAIIKILNKDYIIKLDAVSRGKIVDDTIIISNIDSKNKLIHFLKLFAKKYIKNRLEVLSSQHSFNLENFSITSAKTCWGSCSFNNKLHFTYKLLLCPPEVVDYIIIHEICHTKIKNHSSKFWNLVKFYCPDYKICEKWLKTNRGITEII